MGPDRLDDDPSINTILVLTRDALREGKRHEHGFVSQPAQIPFHNREPAVDFYARFVPTTRIGKAGKR